MALAAALQWLAVARVPLTYDEAWNFQNLAVLGARHVITHYPLPNNHVLFTALHALLLPAGQVARHPMLLRALNGAVVLGLLLLLCGVFSSLLGLSRWRTILGVVASALCAPVFTLYLLVARGYLLGAVLLLAALVLCAGRRGLAWAGALAALAAWSVPTFAYVVPGAFLVTLGLRSPAPRRLRTLLIDAATLGGTYAAVVIACYLPIWREVLKQRSGWTTSPPLGAFTRGVLAQATTLGWAWAGGALLLSLCARLAWQRRRDGAPDAASRLIGILLAGCASYVVTSEVTNALGLAKIPFERNGLFIPLFLMVAVVACLSGLPKIWDAVLCAVLLSSAGSGAWTLGRAFGPSGDPLGYPYYATLSPSPVDRALPELSAAEQVICADFVQPACALYAAHFASLRLVVDLDAAPGGCSAGGTHLPSPKLRVVYLRDGALHNACF